MSGNTIGKLFTVTTAGESHGPAYVGIVDGCPPGPRTLRGGHPARPRPAQARQVAPCDPAARGRRGEDSFRRVRGQDHRHADRATDREHRSALAGLLENPRPFSSRARRLHLSAEIRRARPSRRRAFVSARNRHARGRRRDCEKWLRERHGTAIRGYLAQLGPIALVLKDWNEVERNAFFCPDASKVAELEAYIDALRKEGDSVGARINVVASKVPVGLGEPIFDRLDADIAHALMSINAVKGVEIGAGFAAVRQKGTQHRDEITPQGFLSESRRPAVSWAASPLARTWS